MVGQYRVYNKDSRFLAEIEDETVDVVLTSPPYNVGHNYKSYKDKLSLQNFYALYATTIHSIARVLKKNGIFIIDIADLIVMEDQIVFGAELVKKNCEDANLKFICTHSYVVDDDQKTICFERLNTFERSHSRCEQILCFIKDPDLRLVESIRSHFKFDSVYNYTDLYDTAFWPARLVDHLLNCVSLPQSVVLDPFMGSGNIGRQIIERGGNFIGYDVDETVLTEFGWRYE